MSYLIEDCKEWVELELALIKVGLSEDTTIPDWMRNSPHFFDCWKAGCWLNFMLKEHGATKEEVASIGFVHGQRSLFGDTYKWAVHYLNEFVETKSVADRPGVALADQINAEVFASIRPKI